MNKDEKQGNEPEHENEGQGDEGHGGPAQEHKVKIIINDKSFEVRPGQHTVADIKATGGVPAADDLNQVIDRKLVHLPDSGTVTIKGGEVFISHPKDAKSS